MSPTDITASPGMLVIAATLAAAFSGVPALAVPDRPRGQRLATLLQGMAGVAGLAGAVAVLVSGKTETFTISWTLPFGPCEIAIDPLSALFLLPVFLVSACGALYAIGYWPAHENPATVRRLTLFYGLLTAAMAFLVMTRNGALFLIAWEVMAISCYFVLATEDDRPEVRAAGTLYLITTHIGTLALFALFALTRCASGSFLFPAAGTLAAPPPLAAGIFVAALVGFGIKAGLMPFHIWLPSAHANAPSHVSAVMSGVLLKMGIYGLVRTFSFFQQIPLWWGITLLAAGIISGVAGVAFAIGQHDLKRLLAYHSIENIGIIAMGIGVALIGRTTGSPLLVLFGMAGALLHVLNHATFKSLLFFGAGSVIHATGTREIDLMGGMARRLPYTTLLFLTGAVAICGLPPLNGFVSELFVYLGLFSGVEQASGAAVPVLALAAPALALIGGLAVACFVKVYGVVFLGAPRTEKAAGGHEAGKEMLLPMGTLAFICAGIGLFPFIAAEPLMQAVSAWDPLSVRMAPPIAGVFPFGWLTLLGIALLLLAAVLAVLFHRRLVAAPVGKSGTWDCGYLAPTPRMQYTSSSFAELLVSTFSGILRPHATRPLVKEHHPPPARFASHVPEAVLELVFLPLLRRANDRLAPLRRLQNGQLHLYILYTFVTLVLLLLWMQ